MSKLISVISQKGGVGKSTTTVLLANVLFFYFKLRVAIIDADYPQNSIAKKRKKELDIAKDNPRLQALYDSIYADREPYPIIPTNLPSAISMCERLGDDFDCIFLDVTGTINQDGYKEVLQNINHFLIPCLEDEFSIWSALELYGTIQQQIKPSSAAFEDCHLFFNKIPRMNIIPHLLKQLTPHFNFLPAHLYEYKHYERKYRSTLFPIPRAKKPGVRLF
ncbi:MAG: ParA family protein, partial [Bacteroidota bacterium]